MLGSPAQGWIGVTLNFFWVLSLVVIYMLLNRVAGSQHVQNLFLVAALLNSESVALSLQIKDLLSLDVEEALASFKSRFKLSFLLPAFLQLPFRVVH